MGLTDSQSAQTHTLECAVHYDDDGSYDWNDDNGHPQKNSQKYVPEEVLVGTIGDRFEPSGEPEVGFLVSKSAKTPPLVCLVDDDRMHVMTATMKTVIFKRILGRKSEKSSSLGVGASVATFWRVLSGFHVHEKCSNTFPHSFSIL